MDEKVTINKLKITMATKKMASAAKKSARITAMATAMAVSMGLSAEEVKAAECAFADMAEEMGPGAIIVSMNPFDGFCA